LVLRLQPLRDTDLIVTLLSPSAGRIDALARAARTSRHRFAGSLRLFCEVEVALAPAKGSLVQLGRAELVRDWFGEGVGYDQLCLASYVTELALHASQPDHADPPLYAWLTALLAEAGKGTRGRLRALRLRADVGFLATLGLWPDVAACATCGQSLVAGAAWPRGSEGPLCLGCAGDAPQVSPAILLALGGFADGQPSDLPPGPLRTLEERVAQRIGEALPSRLRSTEALRDAVRADVAAS